MRESSPFSPVQVGQLASFLARLMSRSSILVSRELYSQVLTTLTAPSAQQEERQAALLDILTVTPDDSAWKYFDIEQLEIQSKSARFYKVLEKLYEKQDRTDEILDCYLLDHTRQSLVFSWLARSRVSEKILLERMRTLIELDSGKFSSLVLQYCDGSSENSLLQQILSQLDEDEVTLYSFLHSVVTQSHPPLPRPLYTKHLQLMCGLHPEEVILHLRSKQDHEEYDLTEALNLCSQHGIVEAQVYLLERLGRPKEAFKLLSVRLEERIRGGRVEDVKTEVEGLVGLCQRSEGLEEEWSSLLEAVLDPLSSLQDPGQVSGWRSMVSTVISAMIGQVDSSRLVSTILSHPGYSRTGAWGEVSGVVGDMMEMARHEATLLERLVDVMRGEQGELSRRLVARRGAGVSSYSLTCVLCHKPLVSQSRTVLFSCGHAYHESCLTTAHGRTCWQCVICSSPASSPAVLQSCSPGQAPAAQTGHTQDEERVSRARQFLSLYNSRNTNTTFTPESVIKSETFPLRLKPPAM